MSECDLCYLLISNRLNPTCLHFGVTSGHSWYFCHFEGCPAISVAFGRWTSIFVAKWTVMNERMNFNSLKQLCENHTLITSRLEIDSFGTRVVFIIISCSYSNILFILAGLRSKSLLNLWMAGIALFAARSPKVGPI